MIQLNKLLLKIVFAFIALYSVTSCSSDFELDNLDETIFVRHKNADMPAYLHGNASEKVFLIVLHGGPGGTGLSFRSKAFDTIEEQYGVVYFDQRGSGNSQGNYDKDKVSVDIMAEDVLALVKVLKRKFGDDSRFFLTGASWGGTLGTATLLKDQRDFKGWIGIDGAYNPARLYEQYIETFSTTATNQIALGNSVDFWESVLDFVSKVNPMNNYDDFQKLNSKAFELEDKLFEDGFIAFDENGAGNHSTFYDYNFWIKKWNNNQIDNILVKDQGLFQTADFTSQLPEIRIPSLIISGQYDMVVPVTSAQNYFNNIGSESKELLIFEESGHAPNRSEPDRFATEVLRFMDEHKRDVAVDFN